MSTAYSKFYVSDTCVICANDTSPSDRSKLKTGKLSNRDLSVAEALINYWKVPLESEEGFICLSCNQALSCASTKRQQYAVAIANLKNRSASTAYVGRKLREVLPSLGKVIVPTTSTSSQTPTPEGRKRVTSSPIRLVKKPRTSKSKTLLSTPGPGYNKSPEAEAELMIVKLPSRPRQRQNLFTMADRGEKETYEQFGKRLNSQMINGFVSLSMSLGIQSGIFDALVKLKNEERTFKEIADTAGLKERYVKEWLGIMVAADIVDINPETEKYILPPHRVPYFLTGNERVSDLTTLLTAIPMFGGVYYKMLECLKKDGPRGLSYSDYTDFHTMMGNLSGRWVLNHLVQDFLPSMPQIEQRMKSGIRVLDLGCGRGLSTIVMAENFPNSTFVGLDFSEEATNYGKEMAKEKNLTNIEFVCDDAACIPDDWNNTIDYIYTFDVIHDLAHADKVLSAMSRVLKRDGVFSMIDPDCRTKHSENASNENVARLYTMSLFHCLPISLFFEGSVGLGTGWGREKAQEMLKDAGFQVDSISKPKGSVQAHYMCSKSK